MSEKKKEATSRRNIAIGAAAVVLLAAGVASYAFWPRDRAGAIQKVVAAAAEAKEPEQIRTVVDSAVNSGQLTREEAREAIGNVFQQRMLAIAGDYSKLTTEADRRKFLDEQIDEWEARMRQMTRNGTTRPAWAGGPGDGPATRPAGGQQGGGRGGFGGRMDRMPPQSRAQMAEFFSALNSRRLERGMPAFGGAGGGGGGRRP